jgi:hypothetical protein
MASITQNPGVAPHLLSSVGNQVAVDERSQTVQTPEPRDVSTTFYYYKDSADGSPPAPNYVNNPTSYAREPLPQQLIVHDVRGSEGQYTLDTTGFQFYKHKSVEKDFLDDDHIKAVYYPEVEELLKKAYDSATLLRFRS